MGVAGAQGARRPRKLVLLVTFGKGGLNDEFKGWNWQGIRDEIYKDEAADRGRLIHDARIAALCVHHGISELWSADRDFSKFPELVVRNPLPH